MMRGSPVQSTTTKLSDDTDRRLTHVELLHAPGERALAARVFELLGCTVSDRGNHWFTAFVDGDFIWDAAVVDSTNSNTWMP